MRYDVALSIGTKVEGVIKCTWAELFDENGKKIFSLQNRNYRSDTIIPDEQTIHNSDWINDDVRMNSTDVLLNLRWTRKKIFEAVVEATDYVYDYKVPVRLTSAAVSGISRQLLALNERYKWMVETGLQQRSQRQQEFDKANGVKEKYEQLIRNNEQTIKHLSEDVVYVKPKAFEWYPLNTYLLQGQDVEEARQRYEKSKKLLAASAATIIL